MLKKNWNLSFIVVFYAALLLIFMGASSAFAAQAYVTDQLTDNGTDDKNPRSNINTDVVWAGEGGADVSGGGVADYEIFLYESLPGTTAQLTDNGTDDTFARTNDLGDAVWHEWDGFDYEVWFYERATDTVIQLTDNSTDDLQARINNNGDVVWFGHDGADYEIFLYTGTLPAAQITDETLFQDVNARINDNGDIVWGGHDGTDYETFLYDSASGVTTRLTNNSEDDFQARINNNGEVVWHGTGGSDGGADYEIFLYTGTLPAAQLTTNFTDDLRPRINDFTEVSWYGHDGTDYEIFLYTGTLPAAQLTTNSGDDIDARINDSGDVVWHGHDGTDNEIFLYEGTLPATVLTTNSTDDQNPRINDNSDVVWHGAGGTDAGSDNEIFLSYLTHVVGTGASEIIERDRRTGNRKVSVKLVAEEAGNISIKERLTGPSDPANFRLGNPPSYYEITYDGRTLENSDILVCINYSGVSYNGNEENITLRHYEDTNNDGTPNAWVNVTCDAGVGLCPTPNPDTENNEVCGIVQSFSYFALFEPEVTVDIDIKPGSDPNSINLLAEGVIPVAILTTPEFDAYTVDTSLDENGDGKISFSGASAKIKGKSGGYSSFEDVDGDGDMDLVIHFYVSTIDPSMFEVDGELTYATITGQTTDGTPISGTDSVHIVKE